MLVAGDPTSCMGLRAENLKLISLVSLAASSTWGGGLEGWKHPCCHEASPAQWQSRGGPLPGDAASPSPPRAEMGTFSKPRLKGTCSHLCPTTQ